MPWTSTITGVLGLTGPSVKRCPKSWLGAGSLFAVAVKQTLSTFIWSSKCICGSAALAAAGAARASTAARDKRARVMAGGTYPLFRGRARVLVLDTSRFVAFADVVDVRGQRVALS